jgi:MATE family multidrug resistance protein
MILTTWQQLRGTLALAIPMVLGQALAMSMGLVDAVMVGRGLGTTALAALGLAVNSTFLIGLAGFGIANAVSIMVARAMGAGEIKALADYPRLGAMLGLFYGLFTVGAITALVHVAPAFGYYGQVPEIIAEGSAYAIAYALAFAMALTVAPLRSSLEGRQKAWIGFIILSLAVIFNIFFNWVFIFGNLGLPAMGLLGAGLGSLCANTLALIAFYYWLRRLRLIDDLRPRSFLLPWQRLVALARMAVPISVQVAFEGSTFVLAALIVGLLGPAPLAAYHIAIQLASLSFMVPMGIGFAVAIRVGHAQGRGNFEMVRTIALGSLLFLSCTGMTVGASMGLLRWQLPTLFSDDLAVISLAAGYLLIVALFQVFDHIQVCAMSILRGMGDVFWPTLTTLLGYWIIGLPIGTLLAMKTNLAGKGLWIGLVLGLFWAAILLTWRVWRRLKKQTCLPMPVKID